MTLSHNYYDFNVCNFVISGYNICDFKYKLLGRPNRLPQVMCTCLSSSQIILLMKDKQVFLFDEVKK